MLLSLLNPGSVTPQGSSAATTLDNSAANIGSTETFASTLAAQSLQTQTSVVWQALPQGTELTTPQESSTSTLAATTAPGTSATERVSAASVMGSDSLIANNATLQQLVPPTYLSTLLRAKTAQATDPSTPQAPHSSSKKPDISLAKTQDKSVGIAAQATGLIPEANALATVTTPAPTPITVTATAITPSAAMTTPLATASVTTVTTPSAIPVMTTTQAPMSTLTATTAANRLAPSPATLDMTGVPTANAKSAAPSSPLSSTSVEPGAPVVEGEAPLVSGNSLPTRSSGTDYSEQAASEIQTVGSATPSANTSPLDRQTVDVEALPKVEPATSSPSPSISRAVTGSPAAITASVTAESFTIANSPTGTTPDLSGARTKSAPAALDGLSVSAVSALPATAVATVDAMPMATPSTLPPAPLAGGPKRADGGQASSAKSASVSDDPSTVTSSKTLDASSPPIAVANVDAAQQAVVVVPSAASLLSTLPSAPNQVPAAPSMDQPDDTSVSASVTDVTLNAKGRGATNLTATGSSSTSVAGTAPSSPTKSSTQTAPTSSAAFVIPVPQQHATAQADAAVAVNAAVEVPASPTAHADSGSAAAQSTPQSSPSDVLAHTASAAAMPALSSAQLVQSMHQTQMKLGLNSNEFGNISISTSIANQTLTAQISLDHSALGHMLSAQLPSIQEKLGDAYGLQTRVEIRDTGTQSGMNSGGSNERRDGNRSSGSNYSGSSVSGVSQDSGSVAYTPVPSSRYNDGRLDITI